MRRGILFTLVVYRIKHFPGICAQQSLFVAALLLFAFSLCAQAATTQTLRLSTTVVSAQTTPDFQSWFDGFFESNPPVYTITSTSDYDGDGQFDYLEYYAGTDPTDGTSQLKMVAPVLSGENALISWTSSTFNLSLGEVRRYHLFRSNSSGLSTLAASGATISSLLGENDVDNLGVVDAAQGSAVTTYEDDGDDGTGVSSEFPLFYRVFLSQPQPQAP